MERYVDEWEVSGYESVAIPPNLKVDPKDVHVFQAATHCSANYLLTENVRDFPAGMTPGAGGPRVVRPDDLFCLLWQSDPNTCRAVVEAAQKHLHNPKKSLPEYIDGLLQVHLCKFVTLLRAHYDL